MVAKVPYSSTRVLKVFFSIFSSIAHKESTMQMQPILILSPLLGTPRKQGLHSIPAHLWGPEKARVRQPILILSPLNKRVPPPPVAIFFAPTSALQVISTMRRPFQAIYVGVQSPSPLIQPPPPPLKMARKWEGVGVWSVAVTPLPPNLVVGSEEFYCLWQVHLAKNLPRATHTQKRIKTRYVLVKTCFTYLGW